MCVLTYYYLGILVFGFHNSHIIYTTLFTKQCLILFFFYYLMPLKQWHENCPENNNLINENMLPLTLWGLWTWHFTSLRDSTFWGLFNFFLLNQSFTCHGSQLSSLFTILQEHMSLWPQCNIFFCTTKFVML